jgi:lipopolysaccharide/colanic/teichoic acid biosynthesis glycosyltransferase
VLKPAKKFRDETLVRDRPRLPQRSDARVGISVVALSPPRSGMPIDLDIAMRSKARLFAQKRCLDVIVGLLSLIVLSPLLLIISMAIKASSKGPILFRQTRLGRGNIPFTLIKFRSMYVDRQDLTGIAHTVEGDPRVTKVGRIIRRTYLDELPQLINVLKGEMSIVGPRAQVMGMRAAGRCYEELVPNYHARHAVRPGITGLAQIRGLRGEIKDAQQAIARVDADLEYIRKASLWLDLKILALTIPSVIFGRVTCASDRTSLEVQIRNANNVAR